LKYHRPTLYAVAGSPASGKSSFVQLGIQNGFLPSSAFLHDCDDTMAGIEEYRSDVKHFGSAEAFRRWELVAREKAELDLQHAIELGLDVIYDRSCALPSSYLFLKNLVASKNYRIVLHVMSVERDRAISRSNLREKDTGRHVPLEALQERLKGISTLWPSYLAFTSEATLYDNNDFSRRVIAQYKDGELVVHDQRYYDRFIGNAV
jgi:predicted ABC-type ATPase